MDNRYSSRELSSTQQGGHDDDHDWMGQVANPDAGLHAKVVSQVELVFPPEMNVAYL